MIAVAVQIILPPNHAGLSTAPIAVLLQSVFGSLSGQFVSMIGVVIIGANLIGATWAASRLVFSSAREGLLLGFLSRVDPKTQSLQRALLAVLVLFSAVIALHYGGVAPLGVLLKVAGQNFFVLYGLSVVAYLKLVKHPLFKMFGLATLGLVVLTMGTFGWWLLVPLILMTAGGWTMRMRLKRQTRKDSMGIAN